VVRLVLSLLLLLVFQGCVTMTPAQERLYCQATTDKTLPDLHVAQVEPATAAAISFIVPGLGHLYMGEPLRALAWFVPGIVSPFIATVAAWHDAETVNHIRLAEAYRVYLASPRRDADGTESVIVYCEACGGRVRLDSHWCPTCGKKRW
jgi:hypothetical protein